MPVQVFDKIMNTIYKTCFIAPTAEITIESNPGTLDKSKLGDFVRAGVNRLSVGIQSFNDDVLQFLGRRHSAADALRLIDMGTEMGLGVSGDLIYGIPGDTPDTVIKTCQQINNIGLRHCSMYELTIEAGTPFGRMNLDMPGNDEMAQMYDAIADTLDIPRYEVSNYAAPGHECAHNLNIWDGDAYIGIGRGGAGRVHMGGVWYEQLGNRVQCDPITDETRAIECVIMGMRTVRGCRLTDDVKHVIDMDWVMQHPDMVQIKNNRIAATRDGMMMLDTINLNMVKINEE